MTHSVFTEVILPNLIIVGSLNFMMFGTMIFADRGKGFHFLNMAKGGPDDDD